MSRLGDLIRTERIRQHLTPKQVAKPETVYLLAFKGQRTSKPVAVYLDMGEAINTQDALTVALDVTGTEGEYTVEEIPVWPRKES